MRVRFLRSCAPNGAPERATTDAEPAPRRRSALVMGPVSDPIKIHFAHLWALNHHQANRHARRAVRLQFGHEDCERYGRSIWRVLLGEGSIA